MSREFFYKNSFSLLIPLLFLVSCGNNNKTPKPVSTSSHEKDSINKILKEIHATEKATQLDSLFRNNIRMSGFNGCVLIAQRGQVIYEKSFGVRDLKTKESLQINSAFQLSSTSKTLTAAAILLLKDQGKLKLTDNVQHFFPDFPYSNITINLLLSHRSGLNNYLYFAEPYCDASNCYNGQPFDNNALMQLIMKDKPPIYAPPNKKFEYCNTNYAILVSIIEKISGSGFHDFMEQNIFKPLNMTNTWVHLPENDSLHKNKTFGHNGMSHPEKQQFADNVLGDKGIYSTVDDLFKWDQALYSEKLLKRQTIDEAFTGYSNEHKGKRNYGYGWRLIDMGNSNKIVYHNGWWHGFNSTFFRRPADQTTIILLSNNNNRSAFQIQEIVAILNNNSEVTEMEGLE